MKFIGRETELAELCNAWRSALSGQIRIVSLLAESRLGKTRLVQEFYHWLNQFEDPANYWPDTLPRADDSLLINPEFDAGDAPAVTPPWLWWGLRWTKPDLRNPAEVGRCAVLADAAHLRPHLEAARHRAKIREAQKEALRGVAKTAIGLASETLLFGLGAPALEVLEHFHNWFKLRRESGTDQRNISEREQQRADGEIDELRGLLLTFVASDVMIEGGLPLILVLDDVHWADGASLAFLQRFLEDLVHRGEAKAPIRSRVLIIATAWEREWNEAAAETRENAESRPRSLLEVVSRLQAPIPGRAQLPLQLSVLHLKRIEHGLESLVGDAFPGMTDTQRTLIAERAGGNPGLLLELILKLRDRGRHLFEGSDIRRALTIRGERSVRDMRVVYHELVEERLSRLDPEESLVLQLASHVGEQFPHRLVLQMAAEVSTRSESPTTVEQLHEAMTRADDPLALVQKLSPQFGEFRLPVYRETLQRYLEESTDRLTLTQQAARREILSWIDAETYRSVTPEVRSRFLEFASAELQRSSSDEHDELTQVALLIIWAEQIRSLEIEGRTDPIGPLLDRWLASWQTSGTKAIHRLRREPLASVLFSARNLMRHKDASGVSTTALALLRRAPFDPVTAGLICVLLNNAGRIAAHEYELAGALTFSDELRVTAWRSILQFGATEERYLDLANAACLRADVQAIQDHLDEALQSYQEGERTVDEAIAKLGGSAELQLHRLGTRQSIAHLLERQDRYEEALTLARDWRTLAEQLLERYGATNDSLWMLCSAHWTAGRILLRRDNHEAAAAHFAETMRLSQQLLAEFGTTASRLHLAAYSDTCLADVSRYRGQVNEALVLRRSALEKLERVIRIGPSHEVLQALAAARRELAWELIVVGRLTEAATVLNDSVLMARKVIAQYGMNFGRLQELLAGLSELASLHSNLDRYQAAWLVLEEADRLAVTFSKTHPALQNSASAQRAGIQQQIGIYFLNTEQIEADEHLQLARAIIERLNTDLGENSGRLQSKAHLTHLLGAAAVARGDYDAASSLFSSARDQFLKLVHRFGPLVWIETGLSDATERLAALAAAGGDDTRALELFGEAASRLEAIIANHGSLPLWQHRLMESQLKVADMLLRQEEFDHALKLLENQRAVGNALLESLQPRSSALAAQAKCLTSLASAYLQTGNAAAAISTAREATEMGAEAARLREGTYISLRDLWLSQITLAEAQQQGGRLEDALAQCQSVVEAERGTIEQLGPSVERIANLTSHLRFQADLHVRQGMLQPAFRCLEEAIEVAEKSSPGFSSRPNVGLIGSRRALGRLFARELRFADARAAILKALEAHAALIARSPDSVTWQLLGCALQEDLAEVAESAGDRTLARQLFRETLDARRAICAQHPGPRTLDALALSLMAAGDMHFVMDEPAEALRLYSDATRTSEQLLELQGNTLGNSMRVMFTKRAEARALVALKNLEAATATLEGVLEVAAADRQRFGVVEKLLNLTCSAREELAEIMLARGNLAEAEALFQGAMAVFDELLQHFGANAKRANHAYQFYFWWGRSLLDHGEIDRAIPVLEQTMLLCQRWRTENGETSDALRDLYVAKGMLGKACAMSAQASRGISLLEEALSECDSYLLRVGPSAELVEDVCHALKRLVQALQGLKPNPELTVRISALAERGRKAVEQLGNLDSSRNLQNFAKAFSPVS